MIYERAEPSKRLQLFVKEYWIIENENSVPEPIKIIPDGYPEIIFHYRDPYRINLMGDWEKQDKSLFAGQITKHFFLKNTGQTGMIGIKLWPTAPFELTGNSMDEFTDNVVPMSQLFGDTFDPLARQLQAEISPGNRTNLVDETLLKFIASKAFVREEISAKAVQKILKRNGVMRVEELAESLDVSRRHLERQFKKVVGLTPKYYSRIIRFNRIFEIMKEGSESWIHIALDSGYCDQSHFIKEFKAFAGEEPTSYGFDDKTIANFFLKKE